MVPRASGFLGQDHGRRTNAVAAKGALMFILTIILAIVVGGAFAMAGMGKLTGQAMMAEARTHLGLAPPLWKAVGALEVLGAVGLFIGLFADLAIIGVLAAAGLVAMTIGAVFYHQKAGDAVKEWLPAVVMGSLAIFFAILRVATA